MIERFQLKYSHAPRIVRINFIQTNLRRLQLKHKIDCHVCSVMIHILCARTILGIESIIKSK